MARDAMTMRAATAADAASLGLAQIRLHTNKAFQENLRIYGKRGYRLEREVPLMGGMTVFVNKRIKV